MATFLFLAMEVIKTIGWLLLIVGAVLAVTGMLISVYIKLSDRFRKKNYE